MSWITVNWKSEVLGQTTVAQVLMPDVGQPPFATLYLLHGLGSDSTAWLRHSRIESYVRELPLAIVMPDGYRSFYTNHDSGPAFARHFGEELPAFIERHFRVESAREARAIGGLSMGGYGALRIALAYPDRFASVNSHSGALGWPREERPGSLRRAAVARGWTPEFTAEMERIFGDSPEQTEHDLVNLATRARAAGQLPRILIDCGLEDYLLSDNRTMHAAFEAEQIPHEYREFAGAHTWDYWDEHVRDALSFHAANLGVTVKA